MEARRAVDGNRLSGVRVTEEVFDAGSNLTRTRSIFSYELDPVLDRSGREEKYFTNLRRLRSKFKADRQRNTVGARQCAAAAPAQSLSTPFLFLAAILTLGLCTLIALHTAFGV